MKTILTHKLFLPAGLALILIVGAIVSNWSQVAAAGWVIVGFAALIAGKKFGLKGE